MSQSRPDNLIHQSQGLIFGLGFSLAFTGLIWLAGDRLHTVSLRPDREIAFWYPWVTATPTVWGRLSVWGLYAAHQLTIWWLIWRAQSQSRGYSNSLSRGNLCALIANAVFIALHFLQTHVFYDGLALDVPEQSSQWSVILLLVIVLLMENRRRGLFFGQPVRGRMMEESARALRKYHGYYFAWATIYTFWYHPMVSTPGHLLGFLYLFLMLLQGSLFYTRLHVNKWWMFTQEILVLVHGTLVAFSNAPDFWQMFCFGFAGLFIVTQMHGLGLSVRTRWAFLFTYIVAVSWVFSRIGMRSVHQVLWIPLTEYGVVFVLAAIVWGTMLLCRRWNRLSD
ncbi:MAG: hypothetical protein VB858_12190 [Planctomycetaceae bacterium]